jgi:hypothetical protein
MKARRIVIILSVIVLTSCISVPKSSDEDFDHKAKTIREFATALLSGDPEGAKLLSDSEQWDKIDEWLKSHDPISCKAEGVEAAPLIAPELSGGSWLTSGEFDEQSGEWLVDVVYECQVKSINYCFEMNGTRIEKSNDEWQIVEWGSICDKNDDISSCPNMCQ